MLERLKWIFKKSVTEDFYPIFWTYSQEKTIKSDEYVKFFTSWQYAAITAIADSIAGLNYRLANNKDEAISHEYLDLITPELLQNIAVFMKMTWTAYVWKVKVNWSKKILWLNMLIPDRIKPEIDNSWHLLYWKYYENWNMLKLEVDEVMVFAEFNPYQRWPYITRWYSPIQAIAMTVRWEKEIEDWNYSLLVNDVPPGTVLTTDQWMTPEQVKTIRSNWEENHTGAKNVWKLAILPFGIKPVNIQSSPKEMEFISQQERDRDKILAIYKVPKAVLWIWEWVNVWNVKSFNQIFAQRCLEPLAKKIARVLNQFLFNEVWVFEFLNILPTDEEAVKSHYLSWGITRNEYRQELWYKPIKWWDVFFDWEVAEVAPDKKKDFEIKGVDYLKIAKSSIPWSEERMQKRWEKKQEKNAKYEKDLTVCFKKVFDEEKKGVLKAFDKYYDWKKKAIQKDAMEDHIKLLHKYLALYPLFMTGKVTEIVTDEWKRALQELGVEIEFNPHSKELQKKIKRRIQLVAQQVDSYTDELIWKAINQWINWWLTPDEIRESLKKVFDDLSTTRLKTIVRTEAIRYWTFAEQEAWNKSWVVVKKKWWTALDERVCPFCSKMHWKTIWLNESFFEKWDKMDGENWKILDIDYEDVIGSPLHPNCRCDMIPLLEN